LTAAGEQTTDSHTKRKKYNAKCPKKHDMRNFSNVPQFIDEG